MGELSIDESVAELRELLKRVEQGERVTITRGGAPVARLVPPDAQRSQAEKERIAKVIADILRTRKGRTLGGGVTIRELIEEGRR